MVMQSMVMQLVRMMGKNFDRLMDLHLVLMIKTQLVHAMVMQLLNMMEKYLVQLMDLHLVQMMAI
jgi:hypothetical protein